MKLELGLDSATEQKKELRLMPIVLYDYFRSSAACRVRIALHLKGIFYTATHLNLVHGDQKSPEYLTVNPQGLVPALILGENVLTQSLAIIEYLEEVYPEPPLLPKTPVERARVRALALLIACDIHPLLNLRVKSYFIGDLKHSNEEWTEWYRHFIHAGFKPLEARLSSQKETGTFCHGDSPSFADICLVPQVWNAHRFGIDMSAYPTIRKINEACLALGAFERALPHN